MALSWKVLLFLFFVVLCCCVAGQEQECECVEYYQCSAKNGTIKTDGEGIIEERRMRCPGVQVCCALPPVATGTNATEPEISNSASELPRQEQKCECVHYSLCSEKSGTIITKGDSLIDERSMRCPGMQVCCLLPLEATGTHASEPEITNSPSELPSQEQKCECVDYSLCSAKSGTIITKGDGLIEERSMRCPGMQVCCLLPLEATGTNATEPEITNSPSELPSQEQECECVDYSLCSGKSGTIITKGDSLIEERGMRCPGVQVCCLLPPEAKGTNATESEITNSPSPELNPVTSTYDVFTDVPNPGQGDLQVPNIIPGTGCGRRRFPANLGSVINFTGGQSELPQPTFYGEVPWMVAIWQKKQFWTFKCGGTLITPNVVLTAAHCVKNISIEELSVRAGEYDNGISIKPIPSQTQGVQKVVSHPNFNPGNLHNDIALVFLQQPMHLNPVVDVICLPRSTQPVIGSDCYVTGWGCTSRNRSRQAVLSKVNLPLKTREYCLQKLRTSRLGVGFILHEGFICAGGDDQRDTCKGDGGGPLYCPLRSDPNKMVQIGIVAWGIGSGEGFPTVFASVEHYLPWVQKELSSQ